MMFRWMAALLSAATLLAACGGGADRTKAQVRLVNASSGYAQLDMRVDGQLRQGQVAYANTASYVEIDPGKASTDITRSGFSSALLSFTPGLSENKHFTVLAYGAEGALKQVLLDENSNTPDTNQALLRVLNGAADAGALDIYITGNDDPLASAVPVQAAAAANALGGWFTVASGTRRLRVTAANNKADLRLDVSGINLASKQVATLVLAASSGGVLVNGLLVTQQGGLTRLDLTQARVRAVAGVTEGAAITARLGDTALLTDVASPAVGNYVLLPAGAQTLVVLVNGAPLPSSVQTLVAGADYTLLAHGAAASPAASLIPDDNRVSSDTTRARIRLVNGVSGLAVPLTLTVDLEPVGAGVAAGAASIYATVAATTTAELAVTGSSVGTLYSDVDRTLLAGSTYTVFVLGASTAPRGILRKDR